MGKRVYIYSHSHEKLFTDIQEELIMKATKKIVSIALVVALALSMATSSLACCGVYVGSGVSQNGSTYMGRSEYIGDL